MQDRTTTTTTTPMVPSLSSLSPHHPRNHHGGRRRRRRLRLLLWFEWTVLMTCATVLWNHLYMPLSPSSLAVVVLEHHDSNGRRLDHGMMVTPRPPGVLVLVGNDDQDMHIMPDYGGLRRAVGPDIVPGAIRTIDPDDDLEPFSREMERRNTQMDAAVADVADDDDTSHWYESFDDLDQSDQPCRHLSWSYEVHPSCNIVHEQVVLNLPTGHPLQPYDVQFLDVGGFREARLLRRSSPPQQHQSGDGTASVDAAAVVLKTLRYQREPSHRSSMRDVQKEAHLFDRLQSTGLVSYIYGHCGTSVLVEKGSEIYHDIIPEDTEPVIRRSPALLAPALHHNPKKDDSRAVLLSKNQMTDEQKVEMALAMARSLAALHELGVVHSDVTVYQWLRSDSNNNNDHQRRRIMLNDVNSAEILRWNDETSQYCPYWARYDWGRYKAPEEYIGGYQDAAVDVWAMGNLMYGLLTGEFSHAQSRCSFLLQKTLTVTLLFQNLATTQT
jgi:Protein kinase domain